MDSADLPMTPEHRPRLRATVDEARATPIEPGHLSAKLMQYGSMEVRWYAPHLVDDQVPHDRDELYVVMSGTGVFVRSEESVPFREPGDVTLRGDERVVVQPGDTLFVPAGTEHRFEAMSPDFGAWMIFYGPEGGEKP